MKQQHNVSVNTTTACEQTSENSTPKERRRRQTHQNLASSHVVLESSAVARFNLQWYLLVHREPFSLHLPQLLGEYTHPPASHVLSVLYRENLDHQSLPPLGAGVV